MAHQSDTRFDLQYALREARTVYASFVNLLGTNIQTKVKFDLNPLERAQAQSSNFPV
jgi:hypothetical protein